MLKHSTTSKGFLIDGYPRELDQGKRFEADVAAVECVLYFEVNIHLSSAAIFCRSQTITHVNFYGYKQIFLMICRVLRFR